MTTSSIIFKDLQKLVSHSQQENTRKELFERLKDKSFWIWDKQQHKLEDIKTDGDCCFNHIIGLPTKETIEKPMFDYEKILYDSLLDNESCNALNHTYNKTLKNQQKTESEVLILKEKYEQGVEYSGINRQSPNFIFIDLDRSTFKTERAHKLALTRP